MQRTVNLTCTEGGSNKYYNITLEPQGSGYVVNAASGAIGAAPVFRPKTAKPVTLAEAQAVVDQLVKEKSRKGYKSADGEAKAVAFEGATDKADSGLRPQLLNDIDLKRVEELMYDNAWVMQPKKDGRRCMVRATEAVVIGTNRKGEIVPLEASLAQELKRLARYHGTFTLDGELVDGSLWVFDCLETRDGNIRSRPYTDRQVEARKIVPTTYPGVVQPLMWVPTAREYHLKNQMFRKAQADNWEGVVFKRLDAPYTVGRPHSAAKSTALKYKFFAEADCLVLSHNAKGLRSVNLGLYDDQGKIVPVGSVKVHDSFEMPPVGVVVVVRYLYAVKSLVQPDFRGDGNGRSWRTDKSPGECKLSQLKYRAEEDEA